MLRSINTNIENNLHYVANCELRMEFLAHSSWYETTFGNGQLDSILLFFLHVIDVQKCLLMV